MAPTKKHSLSSADWMARTQGSAAERHGKLPKPSSRATTITNKAKGKTAKTKRNGNFPFLKLPGELRNRIYQYALIDPVNTVTITSSGTALRASRKMMTRRDFAHQQQLQVGSGLTSAEVDLLKNAKHVGQPWKWFLNGRLVPNLLQVCKQIHEEATPFLYSRNHFQFVTQRAMRKFLIQCGKSIVYIEVISLMRLTCIPLLKSTENAFDELVKAVHLKALILEENFLAQRYSDYFAYAAKGWLCSTAARRGGARHALDLLYLSKRFSGHYKGETRQLQHFNGQTDAVERMSSYALTHWRWRDVHHEVAFRKKILVEMEQIETERRSV